jgi:hypothetical protein
MLFQGALDHRYFLLLIASIRIAVVVLRLLIKNHRLDFAQ